jgi:hypothetical protein
MATDKEVVAEEEVTGEALFEEGVEPEIVAEVPEAEAKADEALGEEAPQEEPEDKGDHRIPLRELLDEREKRQQIQAQFEAMQQQVSWQQQQQEAQAQQQQAEANQEMVDIFENPEFYQQAIQQMPQYVNQMVNRQMSMLRHEMTGNMSLALAKQADPETFDKAWETLASRCQQGDNSWRQHILQSADPGGTLVGLYKQSSVVETVGDDPDAYLQAKLDEKLNDPEFLAIALERARGVASAQPNRKVKYPTSVSKGGSGGAGQVTGMSDGELWEDTL